MATVNYDCRCDIIVLITEFNALKGYTFFMQLVSYNVVFKCNINFMRFDSSKRCNVITVYQSCIRLYGDMWHSLYYGIYRATYMV